MNANQLEGLAAQAVRFSLEAGAAEAECTVSEGEEFTAAVRLREVEKLKEAGARGAGLRVLVGQRSGSAYTSDLSDRGIRRMVSSALELARIAGEDSYAGLPEPNELGAVEGDLGLYSEDVTNLETSFKIELAREAEEAALTADPRITNSEGAAFDSNVGHKAFANSRGFCRSYRTSYCSLSTVPIARSDKFMERDYWFSVARGLSSLEKPADIGRRAAERALRRLGSVKVKTQRVPVIFEPRAARSLLENVFNAVNGDAVYRKASFLAGRLGEKIASEKLTVVDDGTMPGLVGSTPFDDEGVPSRRSVVIEDGVLKSYLLNTYTARKLGLKTTGSASRSLTGNPGIGHGNFYAEPGTQSQEEIVASVREGFYLTELLGFGVNIVTGDYSQGAAGMWIRNGELAFPVSEITVAGNLRQMLMDIEVVGSDLEFRGSTAAPTLLIGEMMVGGN